MPSHHTVSLLLLNTVCHNEKKKNTLLRYIKQEPKKKG